MTDWATVENVLDLTGIDVTLPDLKKAQAIVEIFADTTTESTDAGLVSSRNARLLRRATAWQAAWMTEHPDTFTNLDVTSFSQDGQSASQAHANAHLLAPLAKRCIDRLSWHLQPLRAYKPARFYTDTGNRNSAVRDDALPWYPLP